MIEKNTAPTVDVVRNKKEEADSLSSLWRVTGKVRHQQVTADGKGDEMEEGQFVLNVVSGKHELAVRAYFAQVAEWNRGNRFVVQVEILSVKWVAILFTP